MMAKNNLSYLKMLAAKLLENNICDRYIVTLLESIDVIDILLHYLKTRYNRYIVALLENNRYDRYIVTLLENNRYDRYIVSLTGKQ